ncbi:hypothetical protein [Croceicoccus marinus]|jgi:hypothetical protein|uniref:Uncharacterized protein n=1 Tax=Croceicoccus marinus TaxID=450378 RepID=A0A7G6VSE0_9SPHN|nr:hypothetical protein [Croceicoccus marinus]QNE04655.1 hypothetical protein H4O24_11910 [Croceicoccus marinus]
MPLWFFPALVGILAAASLLAGIWLMLHPRDVAAVFARHSSGELARGPGKRRASNGAVWTAIILFNAGWIGALVVWLFVMGGDANLVTDASL